MFTEIRNGQKFRKRMEHFLREVQLRSAEIIKATDLEDRVIGTASDTDDKDHYNGILIKPELTYRIAYHEPTSVIKIFASKAATDLKGEPDEEGKLRYSEKGYKRSYELDQKYHYDADYYGPFKKVPDEIAVNFRDVIDAHAREFSHANEGGFITYAVQDDDKYIYSNKYFTHFITKNPNGTHNLIYSSSLEGKDRDSIPVSPHTSYTEGVVNRVVESGLTFSEAQTLRTKHSAVKKSLIWDGKGHNSDEKLWFKAKLFRARFNQVLSSRRNEVLSESAAVASVYVFNTAAGVFGAMLVVAKHLAVVDSIKAGLDWFDNQIENLKKRRNQSPDCFGYSPDVSDQYPDSDPNRILRKPDASLNASDHVMLNAERSQILRVGEEPEKGMQPESERSFVLYHRKRGNSSDCYPLQNYNGVKPDLDVFEDGFVRLRYKMDDGIYRNWAVYRKDAVVVADRRMQECYRKKFNPAENGGHVVRMDVDPTQTRYFDMFNKVAIKIDDIVDRVRQDIPDLCPHDENLIRAAFSVSAALKERPSSAEPSQERLQVAEQVNEVPQSIEQVAANDEEHGSGLALIPTHIDCFQPEPRGAA